MRPQIDYLFQKTKFRKGINSAISNSPHFMLKKTIFIELYSFFRLCHDMAMVHLVVTHIDSM